MQLSNGSDFSRVLRNLIESTGMPVNKISEATKISRCAMDNYLKRCKNPSVDTLIKLADYFAVPLDYLAGRCSEEEAKAIGDNYSARFMELRRAPYEAYLIGREAVSFDRKVETPWPYNLMDAVFLEAWGDPLDDDQIAGIEAAIGKLTERERKCVLLYYRDGFTMKKIGCLHGVTLERAHQIIAKAIRKLRSAHTKSLMMYGVKGVEERSRLTQFRKELEKEAYFLGECEKRLNEKKTNLQNGTMDIQKEDHMNIGLEEMDLSVRSFNCLKLAGCRKLEDVVKIARKGDLLKVRQLGRKSADEILDKIYEITGERYKAI